MKVIGYKSLLRNQLRAMSKLKRALIKFLVSNMTRGHYIAKGRVLYKSVLNKDSSCRSLFAETRFFR